MKNNNSKFLFKVQKTGKRRKLSSSKIISSDTNRTIKEVIDLESGEIILADDFFRNPEAEIFKTRRILDEAIKGIRPAKFCCIYCKQLVKINGKLTEKGKVKFFAHFKDSDECPIKTNTTLSKTDIERKKYNGIPESQKHKDLKAKIAHYLNINKETQKGIEEVHIEKRIADKDFKRIWKQPDVSAVYKGKHIVFELQLSTTFLSVIVARDEYYRNNKKFIIWVFNFKDTYTDWQSFITKDIYYANKRNAFVFDEEAQKYSEECGDLILHCFWQVPFEDNGKVDIVWENKFVSLKDLSFDHETFKPYFFDSDSLFLDKYSNKLFRDLEKKKEYKYLRILDRFNQDEEQEILYPLTFEEEGVKEERKKLIDSYIEKLKSGLIVPKSFEKNGLFGFKLENQLIIGPEFMSVGPFIQGLSLVKKNIHYGFINYYGEEIIPIRYTMCYGFHDGFFIGRESENWYLINRYNIKEQSIPKTTIKAVKELFINFIKRLRNDFNWDDYPNFKLYYANGYYLHWTLISEKGEHLLPPDFEIASFNQDLYLIKKAKQYGLFDFKRMEVVLPNEFSMVKPLPFSHFLLGRHDRYGLSNLKGEIVIPVKYNLLEWLHSNYFLAKNEQLYGIIDSQNNIIFDFDFQSIELIHVKDKNSRSRILNFYKVMKDGLLGLITYEFKVFAKCKFERIESFNSYFKLRHEGKIGVMDSSGNIICNYEYDDIIIKQDYIRVKKENKWGLLDIKGNLITECVYDQLFDFLPAISIKDINGNKIKLNNYARFKKNGEYGYLNKLGEEYYKQ
jgi:hypothetical protein